jgi:hypothetical protein
MSDSQTEEPIKRITIGSRVATPDGEGTVSKKEVVRDKHRWGVELNEKRFNYSPAYYWPDEISVVAD